MTKQWHELLPMHSLHNSAEPFKTLPDPAIFSETHSLVFREKISSTKIEKALIYWVEGIKEWSNVNTFLIGHIKLFVEGPENLWLSSTGRTINITQSQGWGEWSTNMVNLSVTAIIFGTSKKILGEIARARLKEGLNWLVFDEKNN